MALFPPAPGGGEMVDHGYKGKGVLLHLLVETSGKPIAITSTPANGDERKEVEKLLLERKTELSNHNLRSRSLTILEADKGYDCQWLRQKLLGLNILPVIPWRKQGKSTEEKPSIKKVHEFFQIKPLRWQVERAFSWIKRKCRRIMNRWERLQLNWIAFAKLSIIDYWMEALSI
jgi:transposase